MRILYVCPYYKPAYVYGGPVQSISSLCEGLIHVGATLVVFTTEANGAGRLAVPLQQPIDIDGVPVWYFPLSLNGLSFFYSPSLAKAIRGRVLDFDLVVIDSLWGHALRSTAAACICFQVPYVIPARGQLNPWALRKKRLKKGIYLKVFAYRYVNQAAAIHCTDPTEAEAVKKLGFRSPTFVVPNAVHPGVYGNTQNRGNLRRQFEIPDHAYVLLFLGRLTQIKRPDIAVDVLGKVQSLKREIHLIFVGPDEDKVMNRLRSQARGLGCEDKVHFTGLMKKDFVLFALADADLLLMPSEIQENFGMSALEALATGVPILVSEGIPVGRWAQMVCAGRVVPGTKDAFEQAALELLSKPEKLKAMGRRGQEMVRKHFNSVVVARMMLAQYSAILATGRPMPHVEFRLNRT